MLVLYTDFGWQGPYVGLLKAALYRYAPTVPVIDLFHDLPPFDVQAAAYLLAQYALEFPTGTVFVGVVDPGVGSARPGIILEADGRTYVGPDNGLFDRVAARALEIRCRRIIWRSTRLSATFHGRDLFGPVAAMLAQGTAHPDELGDPHELRLKEWPDELARIVYVDRYGNAMTGIRAAALEAETRLQIGHHQLVRARTYDDVPPGEGFWYENSSGLVEIAVNQGMAALHYSLSPGVPVTLLGPARGIIRPR
ncbi:MAG TPA: SAM-dependent chlorinase/fluorinase [Candidatus Competibacteraceae bacterium]|nr:SAM-dependent chlorinase/fluorinase [Candidatus Competibacteraceae bacterium]